MDPSAGNEAALGLDTTDPAAKDDVVTGTMYLAGESAGRSDLAGGGRDPQLFCSSNALQAGCSSRTDIHMHFTPTEVGEYEIACAELCGLGHYKMHGMLNVVSQEDFDKWLAAREAEKQ